MSSKANPILSTVETIRGYPSVLKIFMCGESKYWQIQCYLDGTTARRSARTTDKGQAKELAKAFLQELLLKRSQQQPLTSSSNFEKAAMDMLEAERKRVKRGDAKDSAVNDAEYILAKDLIPFFKRDHVRNIDTARIEEYLNHIAERKLPDGSTRKLSGPTRRNHMIVLRKVLRHAQEPMRLLERMPRFPKIKIQDNPRAWLSQEQLVRLMIEINKAIRDKVIIRHVPVTEHLRDIVTFQRLNFLRPQDLKILQNKHITLVKRPKGKSYLRILAQGKVKQAQVVTMQAAVPVYERLKGDPEAFVLFPQFSRDHAMSIAAKQFAYCLEKAGLKQDESGAERTMYSLRHSAIMGQLLANKWSITVIARNCRTSVAMIERFYSAGLRPEMLVDSMHQNAAPVSEMQDEPPDELRERAA